MKLFIYGAKSIALGTCRALQKLYPSYQVEGFLVSSLNGNSAILADLPVYAFDEFTSLISGEKADIHILIATPENVHKEIISFLKEKGFMQYTCITSQIEADLMERYFQVSRECLSLHKLPKGSEGSKMEVFSAKFHRDVALQGRYETPEWIVPIQVGSALTDIRVAECQDNSGDNISTKNVNYCELTALYWLWKNRLVLANLDKADYYGLFHYRRMLDISDADILRLKENDVDVVLPFPMLHEPSAFEHHTRYVKNSDWDAMCKALEELYPEYVAKLEKIFSEPYLYNYNMLIAKPEVLTEYCEWLFPILERVEELSEPKGWERSDRYIGYLGENLLTLYFMCNKDRYKIVHTGRRMLV